MLGRDIDPAALVELTEIVGPVHVITDPDQLTAYQTDWTGRFVGHGPAVVRPAITAEVEAIIAVARARGLRLVAQGGNTGLVGGGVPLEGEVVLNLGRFDTIDSVDTAASQVTTGAGATLAAVQAAAHRSGMSYAVDFAARDSATLGGSIATNAGGINVLRHGGTREQVLGVEAVLGTGLTVSHLGGLIKDNTGYHLPSLLCGSEGTLGVVTAARLRLKPDYGERAVALLAYDRAQDAIDAAAAFRARVDTLEAEELFFDQGVRLVCERFRLHPPFTRGYAVYLLVEAAGHEAQTAGLAAGVRAGPEPRDVAVATDKHQRQALWRYREDHTLAINALGPPHKLDVTIPMPAMAHFLTDVGRRVRAARPQATTWLFGHVGDGNIHVNVTGVAPDDEDVDEAVLTQAAELGGSISAEHGIGTAKKRWLHLNRSPDELATMRAIKAALDPDGVLNPNVLLP